MARSKYGSRKVVRDGMTFDSVKEYNRWCELKLLERASKISFLERQFKFPLIPAQYDDNTLGARGGIKRGKLLEREVSYVADFKYYQDGKLVVEDVKGYKGGSAYAVFVIKRKLMLYIHGIRIKEV